MNPESDVRQRDPGELGQRSRALLSAGGLLVAGCSLQDLDYLDNRYGRDGGVSGSLNTSGAGGNAGRGGTGSSNAGTGGTSQGGSGGASGGGAGGAGGSAGIGGTSSGGTTGGAGAGGSAGTAPVNYGGSAGYLGTLGDGGPDGNLIDDPGFEVGIGNWVQQGTPTLTWTTVGPAAGTHCLRASNRSQLWMGPSYPLKDDVVPGATYSITAYMRLSHPNLPIKISTKSLCPGDPSSTFLPAIEGQATTTWAFFEGTFVVPNCALTEFSIFAEEAPTGVEIFLDEVRVVLEP